MKFKLRKPCSQCPFRKDIPQIPLTPAHASRVKAMIRSIVDDDMTFACHQTNEYDEHGEGVDGPKTNFCVGAMIMMMKMGKPHSEIERAVSAGELKVEELDLDAPVFDSPDEMIEAMEKAVFNRPAEDSR